MNIQNYTYISLFCLLLGALFTGIMHEWIVIFFPLHTKQFSLVTDNKTENRFITIYYWSDDHWQTESIPAICSYNNTQEFICTVTASWLLMMQEEQIVPSHISVQSILLSTHGDTAYISFNDTLVQRNKPMIDNLLCIESLLKTLHSNNIPQLQNCLFLVNHTPLTDAHLDFSQSWPIVGFLQKDRT